MPPDQTNTAEAVNFAIEVMQKIADRQESRGETPAFAGCIRTVLAELDRLRSRIMELETQIADASRRFPDDIENALDRAAARVLTEGVK